VQGYREIPLLLTALANTVSKSRQDGDGRLWRMSRLVTLVYVAKKPSMLLGSAKLVFV